ncbi:putative 2-aminoethylphosphonate ABC transporter substrate-binding protein [Neisseriaceae bacterium JH1-16]|nr:putative 2-aminoethylphosphonate ABC transporter substrate-binding protein [Neisseriaceae bacterium JH1-16]
MQLKSLFAATAVALVSFNAAAAGTLTVYTALEADQIKPYEEAFAKANPDIKIRWVRESTGVITAKLLSEKNNPQADVVWGLAATSLQVLANQNMLQPYAPKGLAQITPHFRDPANPPKWVGMDVWAATVCFNTVEAAKKGLPKPTSWEDLTKPIYKGQIVMPHPASSGTGFLDVSAWLQMFGEKKGWDYMDRLHGNIAQYLHSGSKPCTMAASGEYPIGISFEYRGAQLKEKGAPIDLIFPKEGLGWDLEATAIMKGTKNLDAAKKLADFAASREAMEQYDKNYAVLAMPGVAKQNPFIPADYSKRLVKNNFSWAAQQRDTILTEWSKRYESKAAPKN